MSEPCPRCGWPGEPDELAPLQVALALPADRWHRFLERLALLVNLDIRQGLEKLRS